MGISIFKRLMIAVTMVYLLNGCYYDNEAVLYPDNANCSDNPNPTFAFDVLPMLNTKCNSCHGGNSASGGIRLDGYDAVKIYVNNGSLMGSIRHASGYSAMPKNGSKLSTCEINKIQAWIDSGSLNN
jgi:hypothetical protein